MMVTIGDVKRAPDPSAEEVLMALHDDLVRERQNVEDDPSQERALSGAIHRAEQYLDVVRRKG